MREYEEIEREVDEELSRLDAEEEELRRPQLLRYLRKKRNELTCNALVEALEQHEVYPLKLRERIPIPVRFRGTEE